MKIEFIFENRERIEVPMNPGVDGAEAASAIADMVKEKALLSCTNADDIIHALVDLSKVVCVRFLDD